MKLQFPKKQDLFKAILSGLLAKIALWAGAVIIAFISTINLSNELGITTTERILIYIGLGLVSVGIILFIIRKIYKPNIAEIKFTDTDFHVLEKEFTHNYVTKEHIVHIRRWKLRAKKDGLEMFNDKFHWTGEGRRFDIESTKTKLGHSVMMNGHRNVFDLYLYKFGRGLTKNEEIEIEVKFNLYGPHKYFFSTPIEEKTDLLIMNISFPTDWSIESVNCCKSGIQAAKNAFHTVEKMQNGKYTWSIEKPNLLHHYEIKWDL